MRGVYRIRLGSSGQHFEDCLNGGYVGLGYGFTRDFTGEFPDNWREFNRRFIPEFLATRPNKSKIAAGLACATIWTFGKGIEVGDVLLVPDADKCFRVGRVTGGYQHVSGDVLPHRRPVQWMDRIIQSTEMSDALRSSCGARGTVVTLEGHAEEVERLLEGRVPSVRQIEDDLVENLSSFAMEKHLEDFLVANWAQTELGADYVIFEEDGELVGQQYPTDTGPIDILAVSKDKSTLLVVELKKGRTSDVVVGQVLRYMGFVREELADAGQAVQGVVIAAEDCQRLRRALSVVAGDVSFYRYVVSFKLVSTCG